MLDIQAVKAAALRDVERLCALWLGGKRVGKEWHGAKRAAGGPGDSWCVNLANGRWLHGAGDETGGDLIDLYAAVHHVSLSDAIHAVAALVGVTNGADGPARPADRSPRPAIAAPAAPDAPLPEHPPDDAGRPGEHPTHGTPDAEYAYHDAEGRLCFVIGRYRKPDGGKVFAQWTWRRSRWQLKAWPAPRPLYGLRAALRRPQAPVLVVEGEKCQEAANAVLPAYACVTWAGGASGVKTADWTPLAGRSVDIVPDADTPGAQAAAAIAAILIPLGCTVRIARVEGQPEGWDIADAVAEGLSVGDWLSDRWQPVSATPPEEPKRGRPHSGPPPVASQGSAIELWQSAGITASGRANSAGVPAPNSSNVAALLRSDPRFAGLIWFDDFRGKIMVTERGTDRPWTDADEFAVLEYVHTVALLAKIGKDTVSTGIQQVAFANRHNSVTDWLMSLHWDGVPRIDDWCADFLGTPNAAYHRAVARNWLVSMVARAMRPGCQADHMVVLEGLSGRGKSSALAILGGEWYRAAPQAFGSKAFLEVLIGSWLVEIPDMVGFGKREHSEIISAITTRSDSYRAAYGRHAEDHPRTVVFAATSESDEYLRDYRGIRRYWPLRCGEINLTALAAARDQLFAEAFRAYLDGAHWHDVPVLEAQAEQAERQEQDVWLTDIASWAAARDEVTVSDVATYCLNIETARKTQSEANRIAKCLKAIGFIPVVTRVQGASVRVYRRRK